MHEPRKLKTAASLFERIKPYLSGPIFINGFIFQALWFACVLGGANQIIWPCILLLAIMMAWQLKPGNRHTTDLRLIGCALVMGLIVDTAWTLLGFMEFSDTRPIYPFSPIWMLVMWIGFALTINHSLKWLKTHWALPWAMGFYGGPAAYYAGLKLGAVEYLIGTFKMSIILALVWAVSVAFLVKISQLKPASS